MSDPDVRVDTVALRTAARRVADWSARLDEHTSAQGGGIARALADVETTFDGSALGDAVGAVSIGVTRAGDGLVGALAGLGEGLEHAARRYEQVDLASRDRLDGTHP